MAKRSIARKIILIAMLSLSLVGAMGSSVVVGQNNDVRRAVPHLGAYEALGLFNSGRIILLDVHREQGKVRSDIVGAFYIPADKLDHVKLNIPERMFLGVFCD